MPGTRKPPAAPPDPPGTQRIDHLIDAVEGVAKQLAVLQHFLDEMRDEFQSSSPHYI